MAYGEVTTKLHTFIISTSDEARNNHLTPVAFTSLATGFYDEWAPGCLDIVWKKAIPFSVGNRTPVSILQLTLH
jgi:hypothetical protein